MVPHAPWRDHDPSRGGAVGHGSDDSARHAGRDHGASPDSVGELPFGGRGGLPARRFRRSRSGRGHIVDKQEPDSDSERTGTSCKKLPPHMLDRRFDLQKACALLFSASTNPRCSGRECLRSDFGRSSDAPQRLACAASASLWVCGQRKSVAHKPYRLNSKPQQLLKLQETNIIRSG